MRRHDLVALALLALSAAACSKKPPVVAAPPDTGAARPPTTPGGGANPGGGPATNPTGNEAAVRTALLADLGNMIHFDFDQDVVKAEDRANLDRKAEIMKANPALRIRISGHADERGSDEYNLVLGNKRALSAKRYLESKGVEGSRIEVTSLGEERPIDPASTEDAWAKNRRDEFEIVAGGDRLVAPR